MKRVFAHIILLGDLKTVSLFSDDWFRYWWGTVSLVMPLAVLIEAFNTWFGTSILFWSLLFIALGTNAIVGAVKHLKFKTFNPRKAFWKNVEMFGAAAVTYIMLDIIRIIAGDNLAGEYFGKAIQITAVLFPISKILKNIFILTDGKHPPEFIMKRVYDFEKNGDLKKLFETGKKDEEVKDN